MAGQISKLFIFFIVINSLVSFVGGAGLLGDEADVARAEDYINKLETESMAAKEETNTTSGITVLEYFNPLNYETVSNVLSLATGFFIDPLLLFGALPNPLSYMFGIMFGVLEALAIAGFVRGVVA